MRAHFGDIRPIGLTLISHITSPPQPREKLPRCIRCQSFADPLLELYWHIGETTARLARVSPRSVTGENKARIIVSNPLVLSCAKSTDTAPRDFPSLGLAEKSRSGLWGKRGIGAPAFFPPRCKHFSVKRSRSPEHGAAWHRCQFLVAVPA